MVRSFQFPREPNAPLSRTQFQALVRTVARKQSDNWNAGLTGNNVEALARGVNYKDGRNVRRAIGDATTWLKRRVGDKPYALISSDDGSYDAHRPTRFKSDEWLAPQAVKAIGRWPAVVVPDGWGGVNARLRRTGVNTFVYIDDATYSGTQIVDVIKTFRKHAPPASKLFVAVGFASKRARDLISQAADTSAGVAFYVSSDMSNVEGFLATLPNNQAKKRMMDFLKVGREYNEQFVRRLSFAVMAHKVPDNISFPVVVGARGLGRVMRKPPYKRSTMDPTLEFGQAYEHDGVHYVSLKETGDAKWTHMGHRYSRGKPRATPEFTSVYPGKRALARHLAHSS